MWGCGLHSCGSGCGICDSSNECLSLWAREQFFSGGREDIIRVGCEFFKVVTFRVGAPKKFTRRLFKNIFTAHPTVARTEEYF
jgi:hypothetical protein